MTEHIQISIIGTGCIGTSMGLALHQSELEQSLVVVGHDKEPKHTSSAKRLKAIDKSNWNLIAACEEADIVVLAIPMGGIKDTLQALAPYLKEGCVVTDTASLKSPVIQWAEELLPETANFVGGHPLVASAGRGPEAAEAALFQDTFYCLTPAPKAHPDAVSLISSLVSLLGARPYYLDPAEHDGLIAGVTHLPQALALALVSSTTQETSWREMGKLAGKSFEQISAFIDEDPDELSNLLLTNRANLVRWLDNCITSLTTARNLIDEGEQEPLAEFIDQAVVARRQWIVDRERKFDEPKISVEVERPSFLRQFLLGRRSND